MNTHVVTIELPIGVSDNEAKLLLSLKLFETGQATLGQAARMAGFSKRAFMEILGQHKIPVFNYSAADLEREFQI